VMIKGAVRDMSVIKVGKESVVIIAKNNDKPEFIRFK